MLPIHVILHPTDLSEESSAAFQFASALARDYGARLVLLTTYPPPLNGADAPDRARRDGIEGDLHAKLHALKPHDPAVSVDYRVEEGRPADVILAVAKKIHADLIVMGTFGRSAHRRLVMGSVTEAVNRGATCPVTCVRGELQPAPEPVPASVPVGNVVKAKVGS